jgi:hypothetical protein
MSWEQFTWLRVGLGFHYLVFSTYNYDTYQYGYQHEPVSFCIKLKLVTPQLSAGPLGNAIEI